MLRVYIAGPYTKGDVAQNVRAAVAAADQVWELGFAPYVPHLTHFWHLLSPKDYEDWLALDLAWLRQCDFLVRLPGESAGADREAQAAREVGQRVFHGVEEFVAFVRGGG